MKRMFIIAMVFALISTSGGVAAQKSGLAIGEEGSLNLTGGGGLPMNAMLTLHLPQIPLMLAVGILTPMAVVVTVDYWLAQGTLISVLEWYAGVGAYLSVSIDFPLSIMAGVRVPLGIRLWPLGQILEIFAEIAPTSGFTNVPTSFERCFQGALGCRFWL